MNNIIALSLSSRATVRSREIWILLPIINPYFSNLPPTAGSVEMRIKNMVKKISIILLFLITLSGAFFRIYSLEKQPYWMDEGYTVNAVMSAMEKGETVLDSGVTILGPLNIPSEIPYHASQMYSKNIITFLLHLVKDGALAVDLDDEITRETLLAHGGKVVHPRLRELLGLEPSHQSSDAGPESQKPAAGSEAPDAEPEKPGANPGKSSDSKKQGA